MGKPDIFFRKSEFAKIKQDYIIQQTEIDLEVENYFDNTNSIEDLYSKVYGLNNSQEIKDVLISNMVMLKNDPIGTRNQWEPSSNPFSYGADSSFHISNSKFVFNFSLVIICLFVFAAIKRSRIQKTLGYLLLLFIGWNLYNYYIKEPDFLAKPNHFINVVEYRNKKMLQKANEKLYELYKPKYQSYSNTTYDYDVEGIDSYGDYVEGSINVSGKYGIGFIIDENSNEKEIEVEWISNGEILGSDDKGNEYELRVKH